MGRPKNSTLKIQLYSANSLVAIWKCPEIRENGMFLYPENENIQQQCERNWDFSCYTKCGKEL